MSGGSFDYAYSRLSYFADELQNKLDSSEEKFDDEDKIIPILQNVVEFSEYLSKLMKEVEWLYSGDTGEDTFLNRIVDIESKFGIMRIEK